MGFLTYLRRDLEQVLFSNRDPHAIPAMDGAFSPNERLDQATPIGDPLPGADAVAEAVDGTICVSAGRTVWRLSGPRYAERAVFVELDSDVGGLAFHPDGRLLACTARGLAAIEPGGRTAYLREAEGEPLRCLTAVAAAADGTIFACDGSTRREAEAWCVDLMERNSLGRIITCGPALQNARVLARGLNYPGGVAVSATGSLWFTESFAHRISRATITGPGAVAEPRTVIRNMPGYPSRLGSSCDGGFWLSIFAVRTHLVEFVLREDDFRTEMMRTIPPKYWVAPALAGSGDCLELMQSGGIKALGIEKPWAPPRSYGLVARLDADGEVVETLHSRVGGRYHGITAAIQTAQGLVIVSKGSGRLLLHKTDVHT